MFLAEVSSNTITDSLSLLDLAMKGGWIMFVLLLLSIWVLYRFFSKLFELYRAKREERSFMGRIKEYVSEGKFEQAIKLCEETDSPLARMLAKGLSRQGHSMNDILVIVENVGNIEIGRLNNGLPFVATTAAIAPMIGFLGTVTGMIRAFFDIAREGGAGVNISLLSSGIYEALVTTVGGLIVGILALFCYNYLVARIEKLMTHFETKTMEFMDMLNESSK